jgi:hypothetical protein
VNPLNGEQRTLLEEGGSMVQMPSLAVSSQQIAVSSEGLAQQLEANGRRLTLDFLTPTRIVHQERLVHQPHFSPLFARLLDRVSALRSQFAEGTPLPEEEKAHLRIRPVQGSITASVRSSRGLRSPVGAGRGPEPARLEARRICIELGSTTTNWERNEAGEERISEGVKQKRDDWRVSFLFVAGLHICFICTCAGRKRGNSFYSQLAVVFLCGTPGLKVFCSEWIYIAVGCDKIESANERVSDVNSLEKVVVCRQLVGQSPTPG